MSGIANARPPFAWSFAARTTNPPHPPANGVYQLDRGTHTRLEIGVEESGGMDYVFLGKTLSFDRLSGKLIFTTDHLQLAEVNGALLAGDVRGNADISLAHDDPR